MTAIDEQDIDPVARQEAETLRPAAGLWSRFWARNFDLMIFGVVVRLALAPVFPDIFWATSFWGGLIEAILWLPLALVLDALVMASFGTTPGKALWGLSVRSATGARLSLPAIVKRNFGFWLYGFGAGIPLLGIVTLALNYWQGRKGLPARWDRGAGHQVRQKPIGWLRRIAAFLALVFVLLVVWQIDRSQTASWSNPQTGNSIRVPVSWKIARPVPDGLELVAFQEDEGAVVTLSRGPAAGATVSLVIENLKADQSRGLLVGAASRPGDGAIGEIWDISYRQALDNKTFDHIVSVWQIGDTRWLMTVLKPIDDEKTRGYAEATAADVLASFLPQRR